MRPGINLLLPCRPNFCLKTFMSLFSFFFAASSGFLTVLVGSGTACSAFGVLATGYTTLTKHNRNYSLAIKSLINCSRLAFSVISIVCSFLLEKFEQGETSATSFDSGTYSMETGTSIKPVIQPIVSFDSGFVFNILNSSNSF